ncbi:DUF1992 domain-containing protein [Geobacter sp. DSM 9736]|nr:DUF1992 domain-containing protein [Geobacter sp. DSM 9736]SNB46868.1 hypothetical protein SAMN06269301_2339 [Geobacter sp. DSM 9736]
MDILATIAERKIQEAMAAGAFAGLNNLTFSTGS